ncbi:ABC transporter permease [Cellulomonas bogoriensis]|uniref:Nitrate ABC transporter permease n=1 Tax=Cellulomonas bogoriensis 69B4 = DSM 16987 TaxID=1386082 RepID=A0A0A0C2G3_9CELL|nr:ABC transporter permease subunit [Cellulomonas bogoriensis]KGM14172.1 nitrate ABC transporter permease [Cellulomonas bogoriensis 69B4 = DSM 16987]
MSAPTAGGRGTTVAREALPRVAAPVLLAGGLLVVWEVAVVTAQIPPFLLPSPRAIAGEVQAMWPTLSGAIVVTGTNALVGLVIGALVGVGAAILAGMARSVDRVLAPMVAGLAVVPIVALAPVLYTMFGAAAETARWVVAAVAAFVPVFVTTLRGLRQTRPVHRDLLRVYAATRRQVTRTLTIPTALPFVFTGLRLASSLAVISAIVAEYFGGPRTGIGSFITTAAAGSNYARAWAFVVGGVVVGLVFYGVTLALEHLVRRRTAPVVSR